MDALMMLDGPHAPQVGGNRPAVVALGCDPGPRSGAAVLVDVHARRLLRVVVWRPRVRQRQQVVEVTHWASVDGAPAEGVVVSTHIGPPGGPEVARYLLHLGERRPSTVAVEAVRSYGRVRAASLVALAESAGEAIGALMASGAPVPMRPAAAEWRHSLARIPASTPADECDRIVRLTLERLGWHVPEAVDHGATWDAIGVALYGAAHAGRALREAA